MTTTTTATRKAPAKKAPAKAAPKPAAAKAPAAKKTAEATAAPKLRWSYPEGRANRKGNPQTGVLGDAEYGITPTGDGKWKATVKRGGKTTVLGDAVAHGKAYRLCVEAAKGAAK